jgi:hypothetical protein
VTIERRTINETFVVLPIDLSGFKDFGPSQSEFQQMVESDKATGTVKHRDYWQERFGDPQECVHADNVPSFKETVFCLRFEVFTVVTMKNGVFWDDALCGSCKNRSFGGT